MIVELVLFSAIALCVLIGLYAAYLFTKTPADQKFLYGRSDISIVEGLLVAGIFLFAFWLSPKINQYVLSLSGAWKIVTIMFAALYILATLILVIYLKNKA